MTSEVEDRDSAKIAEALADLQQYLSDAVSPLVVTRSLEVLLSCPVAVVAQEIRDWTGAQYRRQGASIPISDYLFHAVRKLHLVGEFRLVEPEALASFLASLKLAVLEYCPEADRELLANNLANLGDSSTAMTQPVSILHRQAGSEGALAVTEGAPGTSAALLTGSAAAPLPADQARRERRVALLLQRLETHLQNVQGDPRAGHLGELGTRLLAAAAATTESPEELGQFREQLRLRGLEAKMDEVFRLLSHSLPAWAPAPQGAVGGAAALPTFGGAASGAMRRLVAIDQDPKEVAQRYISLVEAAIEQVNGGSAARAGAMLGTAAGLLAEKRGDAGTVQAFMARAHERLAPARLKALADDPTQHASLARVLDFFPGTTPDSLFDALQGEERRDRRRLQLSLLEACGAPARRQAARRLAASSATFGDRDAFLQRNLVNLLRRIPRPDDMPLDEEIELVVPLSDPRRPAPLVKEAVAYLGQVRHADAEKALLGRLDELELQLGQAGEGAKPHDALVVVLDRVVHALARSATAVAHRAVVDHGLKTQPQLGDTAGRLAYLAGQDLSNEADIVARLLRALEAELPRKILGFSLPRRPQRALAIIEALSTTPRKQVQAALADLAGRFAGQAPGDAAARVLAAFEAGAGSEEAQGLTLSGDLEVFGIPNLLQTLAQSEATGTLTINDSAGLEDTVITWEGGGVATARHGAITGDEAVYQILERPVSATFQFSGRRPTPGQPRKAGRDILPILLEAMRRVDLLVRATGLVPDEATFRSGPAKPTTPADEPDTAMVQSVWLAAITGASALDCEEDHAHDSYRIRRLLARWVEEGSLIPK